VLTAKAALAVPRRRWAVVRAALDFWRRMPAVLAERVRGERRP
jgi:hypothetical protein